MADWLGDYPEDHATVTCMFTTHQASGAAVAPLSAFEAADIIIYKNGSGTQKTSTNGITMTSPFDSIVGLHCIVIDTSNDTGDSGFWVHNAVYTIVLSPDTETVDGTAVTRVIGQFGIELYGAVRPTTLQRRLDVSAGGEAGLDWANIGSPTTAQNLSATNIDTDQVVASVSGAVGSVTGSVGSVTGLTAADVGAIKTKTDFLPSATAGAAGGVFIAGTNAATTVTTSFTTTFTGNLTGSVGSVVGAVGSVTGAVGSVTGAVGSVTGNVSGNVTGTIGGLTAAALKDFFDTDSTTTYASAVAGSVVKEIADNASGSGGPSAADIADAVWDEALAGHLGAGSAGEALDAAATGGSAPTADQNADALLDRVDAIETGLTVRQAMRLSAAADGGKVSGGATTTNTFRNAVADDTDRIIATVDADGNRTAITYDLA